ncbi:DL-methionine transporter subunit [Haemophilus pittmaniae]|jgi:ATP-dependent helicase hepA|uniref:Probable D-methionine transport system permease protein MetI n=1 Tax=Haemophilus pittmaniae TaxID=249188 RepID=A0A377IWN2_9PAST|nr:methionine ABC transporter permease [Haemophilus pittmaniae]MBS6026610.1 ABC transporter permease [Haemophilus pittmaniae]STO92593.1 DL-methionine transporter subunit [Haemophilus pittmaniae]
MFNEFLTAFNQQLTPQVWGVVATSTYETVYISFVSTFLAMVVGIPLGVITFLTGKGEILENRRCNFILNTIINIGRSIPFIILLLILLPVTRFIVGTVLGTTAAIIPLAICAMPFVARLTSNALMEIPQGLTEAAQSMGATNWQIVRKFYLPEALPTLINGITLTLVTLVGYSAMAGTQGGGGLGSLAINYGVYRNMPYITWVATIIIVLFVMLSQKLGDMLAEYVDHR